MSASNNFETSLLNLILNNTDITGVARGAASAGNLYLSLHTGNPDEGGNQASSEATYTDYARVATARDGTVWTVVGDQASNSVVLSFPLASGGSDVISHWGIGTDATGNGTLLLYGELDNTLNVSAGIRPIFDTTDLKIFVD